MTASNPLKSFSANGPRRWVVMELPAGKTGEVFRPRLHQTTGLGGLLRTVREVRDRVRAPRSTRTGMSALLAATTFSPDLTFGMRSTSEAWGYGEKVLSTRPSSGPASLAMGEAGPS